MKTKLKIIVLGYIVRAPIGGLTWHYLQYVMGLAKLGHEVYYMEDSDDYKSCYHPKKHLMTSDPTYGLSYIKKVFKRVGLCQSWCYYDAHTTKLLGPCSERMNEVLQNADILINISGVNPIRQKYLNIPVRILIDTDPAFSQIHHLTDSKKLKNAQQHTAHFSFGENLMDDNALVPDDGFSWLPTRQPVYFDEWEVTPGPQKGKFTTVMQWDSYKAVYYNGQEYGLKSKNFEHYLNLPSKTSEHLELALGSRKAPRDLLRTNGWAVKDPLKITEDPWTYQNYIQQSKAEFSIAKHGYVMSNCGWFSERSAAYLASGRPVLVQDTGFSEFISTGKGLITFQSPEEAVEGLNKINRDYKSHCKYAREIAEEYFNSSKVLKSLLDRVH